MKQAQHEQKKERNINISTQFKNFGFALMIIKAQSKVFNVLVSQRAMTTLKHPHESLIVTKRTHTSYLIVKKSNLEILDSRISLTTTMRNHKLCSIFVFLCFMLDVFNWLFL